eukprot:CAMPEP_0178442330 /NCGR_PEP_ID=MMETSP0689_2-20121128/38084_1 /TAXON_ID=160604 /ORGANISM="Amphidinium massartii, Strain CS-259" /LENGTH=58 /DNA_ID=CAMNT_0020065823 /DNA_START=111 /DNA_END=287 /DNA_ORIENTATION=-
MSSFRERCGAARDLSWAKKASGRLRMFLSMPGAVFIATARFTREIANELLAIRAPALR